MNVTIAFTFFILGVNGTCQWRQDFAFHELEVQLQMEIDLQMGIEAEVGLGIEMDDDFVPEDDPVWWFVRSAEEELWVSELSTNYPRTSIFSEEILNMLQFILIGEPEVVNSLLVDCPLPLYLDLIEIQGTIRQRRAIRFQNNWFQNLDSSSFDLNYLFGEDQIGDIEQYMDPE